MSNHLKPTQESFCEQKSKELIFSVKSLKPFEQIILQEIIEWADREY